MKNGIKIWSRTQNGILLIAATTQGTFTNGQSTARGATSLISQTAFWLRTQGISDSTSPAIACPSK